MEVDLLKRQTFEEGKFSVFKMIIGHNHTSHKALGAHQVAPHVPYTFCTQQEIDSITEF